MKYAISEEIIEVFDKYVSRMKTNPESISLKGLCYIKKGVPFPFTLESRKDGDAVELDDVELVHGNVLAEYITHSHRWDSSTEGKSNRKTMELIFPVISPAMNRVRKSNFDAIEENIQNEDDVDILKGIVMRIYKELSREFNPGEYGDGFGDDDGYLARVAMGLISEEFDYNAHTWGKLYGN